MPAPIKICTRRSFRNRRGACSEIEEAAAQKSKRRLLSQKLGCLEITRVDLRNRRGVCFLKSWAAQRPRRPISKIEEALAFSKAGLPRDHEGRYQKSKRHLLFQPFPALSAPVTRTLSFAEIMGILSKTSGEVENT
ncbi:hypothetical protein ACFX1R_046760 [Malus domestica]